MGYTEPQRIILPCSVLALARNFSSAVWSIFRRARSTAASTCGSAVGVRAAKPFAHGSVGGELENREEYGDGDTEASLFWLWEMEVEREADSKPSGDKESTADDWTFPLLRGLMTASDQTLPA